MEKPHHKSHSLIDLSHFEEDLYAKGHTGVCGVDEVGRGPLAGPVVAAAVIIPKGVRIAGVNDSKKLSSSQRDEVFAEIAELGIPCAIGIIDHETIDKVNILQASLMAMRKAVMELHPRPDVLLIDGSYSIPNMSQPQFAIVGGDARCLSIGAASIVAKVTRDRIMDEYQRLYPSFSFTEHKGYPTPAHLKELEHFGPCPIHRRSFRPVAECLQTYAF